MTSAKTEVGAGEAWGGERGGYSRGGSVSLPRQRCVEEKAFHAENPRDWARGPSDPCRALSAPHRHLGAWNLFCSREKTSSIFQGKPCPQLTFRETLGKAFNIPGFLGTPAGMTTTSQPFRQSGSCSGPR